MPVFFGTQRATLCRCCFISSLSLWFTFGKMSVFFDTQRSMLCRCCFISSLSLWFTSGKASVCFATQHTMRCNLSLWISGEGRQAAGGDVSGAPVSEVRIAAATERTV